jgi:hypothetical protein
MIKMTRALLVVLVIFVQAFYPTNVMAEASDVPQTFAGRYIAAANNPSSPSGLTPAAREAASLLGILPKVERLIQIRNSKTDPDSVPTDEEMDLKVDVLDKVLGASLEVRMITDRIDRELTWSFAIMNMLQSKRQRNLNILFTANFLEAGILGVIAGGYFLKKQDQTGIEILLVSASIGLGLTALSIMGSRSGKRKIDGKTTILADVFHLPQPEPEHSFGLITRFLNSPQPDSSDNKTRIEILVDNWKEHRFLRKIDEPNLVRLASAQPEARKMKENIGLISTRIHMLSDTQLSVEQLDIGLLELLRATKLD